MQTYINPEELGLSQSQFNAKQKELEKEVSRHLAAERDKSYQAYYIFPSREQRDLALKKISEFRQHDDAFRFLTNWHPDNKNESGVAMEFSKTPREAEADLLDFFSHHGLQAVRLHHVDAENQATIMTDSPEQVPEESQGKVLPFPKKDKTSYPKAA